MEHVFAETNWVVDVAAPKHHQRPVARALLDRCVNGELVLHVPAICFVEARRVILKKFQPRNEVEAIRDFLGRAREDGVVADDEAQATYRVLDKFRSSVRRELQNLDSTLDAIRRFANLDVFALNDRMLEVPVELSFRELALDPFDQAILGGVLGRADELRAETGTKFVLCERDGDLQPWDKVGNPKQPLASIYDGRRVWVYGDFDMSGKQPPAGWPESADG